MITLSLHRVMLWLSGILFGMSLIITVDGFYDIAAVNFFLSIISYGVYYMLDEKFNGF